MNNTALLISTYDGAEDLWFPLEQTYRKFWPDLNMPVYLTTNKKDFNSQIFKSLKIGEEISWSDNIIKSLHKVEEDFVLLTFDDLFLNSLVDNDKVKSLMQFAIEKDINYLQFYRSISIGKRVNRLLFKKNKSTYYKNSTVWSFWKKEVLIDLLVDNESAWEFEIEGNKRAIKFDDFYSTRYNMIPFLNGVIKGKWNPIVKNKLLKIGVQIEGGRESLSFFQTIVYKFRDMQFDLITYIIHKIF